MTFSWLKKQPITFLAERERNRLRKRFLQQNVGFRILPVAGVVARKADWRGASFVVSCCAKAINKCAVGKWSLQNESTAEINPHILKLLQIEFTFLQHMAKAPLYINVIC